MNRISQSTIDKLHAIIAEFYLDSNGDIRRTNDGYFNRFQAGDLAKFFKVTQGYLHIQTPKQRNTTRRSHIVWLLNGNELKVDHIIDHIDGDVSNDSIDNLRLIPHELNNRNRRKRSDNTSGITGVMWDSKKSAYIIRKTIGNKRITKQSKTLDKAIEILNHLKELDNSYTDRHGY